MSNHGVAITVWDEINSSQDGYEAFKKEVQLQRIRRFSATCITRWWKHHKASLDRDSVDTSNTQSHDTGKAKRFFKTSLNKNARSTVLSSGKSLRSKLKRTAISLGLEHKESFQPYPERVIKLGQESYNSMQTTAVLGERIMVQKCYILLGGDQSEQFLQFRSLQHLVGMESKVCFASLVTRQSNICAQLIVRCMISQLKRTQGRETSRHKFLDAVQSVSL